MNRKKRKSLILRNAYMETIMTIFIIHITILFVAISIAPTLATNVDVDVLVIQPEQ